MSAVAMACWPQQMRVTNDEARGRLEASGSREGGDVQRMDLCALARHALALLCTTGHVQASEVELQLPHEPIWARVSPGRMEQVMLHLIADAVVTRRAAQAGTRAVRLRVEPQDDFGDYGPSIHMLYTAASGTLPEPRGTGEGMQVGLTVARELVEAQGGQVAVKRQGLSGGQMTVVVKLPDEGTASW